MEDSSKSGQQSKIIKIFVVAFFYLAIAFVVDLVVYILLSFFVGDFLAEWMGTILASIAVVGYGFFMLFRKDYYGLKVYFTLTLINKSLPFILRFLEKI